MYKRQVQEQVAPTAFDECDMSDVIFQDDHNGRVFARTRNKTLELSVDNRGLFIRANLGGKMCIRDRIIHVSKGLEQSIEILRFIGKKMEV